MKSLFDRNDNQEIINRLSKLTSGSQAQWGKMNVGQMLAHCKVPLQGALGDVIPKRSFIGRLIGGIAKKQVLGDEPFKQGLPTDKSFVITDKREFEQERSALAKLVQRFQAVGHSGMSEEPHPFFGRMSAQDWDKLMWKHLDHHLRQFGV